MLEAAGAGGGIEEAGAGRGLGEGGPEGIEEGATGGFGPGGAEETRTDVVLIGKAGAVAGQMARDGEVQQELEKGVGGRGGAKWKGHNNHKTATLTITTQEEMRGPGAGFRWLTGRFRKGNESHRKDR